MTREGAAKVLGKIWGPYVDADLANRYVDAFVTLGMLKLDEPKFSNNEIDRVREMLCSIGLAQASPNDLYRALERARLKIVKA